MNKNVLQAFFPPNTLNIHVFHLNKNNMCQAECGAHAYHPSTWETEAGRLLAQD
jgi:hypothetical protein